MTQRIPGRHRKPGRLSMASGPLTRSAAVAATSAGLLAGSAVTATATANSMPTDIGPADHATEVLPAELVRDVVDTVLSPEYPAVAADAPKKIEDPASFGTAGFEGVTHTPEPVVEQVTGVAAGRAGESASRSQERSEPQQEQPQQAQPQQAEPQEQAPAAGGILGIAAQYVGIPYVWGGSTPSGFDCSGFTSYVFAQAGVSIPRTSQAQQASATPVSNPQPGDLVFYGYPAWHVGIYAGDGMMYDSPKPGKSVSLRPMFDGVSGYGRF